MGGSDSKSDENKEIILSMPIEKIYELRKPICKIEYKEDDKNFSGTGFFMMINNNKYLLVNYNIINQNQINNEIYVELYNKNKIKIELNNRDLKFFKELCITIIEIKYVDEIYKDAYTLEYDLDYKKGYDQYKNIGVFCLEYPQDEIESASGILTDISDYEFRHNIYTKLGSEGSPIISLKTLKVIGVHKKGDVSKEPKNYGTFIGEFIKKIKDDSNYIVGEMLISNDDIGKDIRIINTYDDYCRKNESLKKSIKEELKNEKEITESIIIEINNIRVPFSYVHKFEEKGKYQIKYIFNKSIKNCNMLFHKCSSLIKLDLSKFKTENLTNMWGMFWNCSSLLNLDLSNFNTEKVTDMKDLFQDCSSLVNLDVSSFNTQNAFNICGMFHNCSSLKKLDLSGFDTKKVKLMCGVFHNCSSLISLNISNFNTENVINMGGLFYGCSSLTSLNVSSFNTENVINMNDMFKECSSLIDLDLSNFNTQNVSTMLNMFNGCSSLVNLNLSNFNTQNASNMQGMFDKCEAFKIKSINTTDHKILEEMIGKN